MFRFGIGAMPFLLPLMLQLGFGLTPFQSGLITFASAVGAMGMKTVIARIILRRFGFRSVADRERAGQRGVARRLRDFHAGDAVRAGSSACCWSAASSARCNSPAINTIAYADVDHAADEPGHLAGRGRRSRSSISAGVAIGALAVDLTLRCADGHRDDFSRSSRDFQRGAVHRDARDAGIDSAHGGRFRHDADAGRRRRRSLATAARREPAAGRTDVRSRCRSSDRQPRIRRTIRGSPSPAGRARLNRSGSPPA